MLGKKIKFKIPKVPGKNFIKGKFVILEPVNPLKHSKDLFDTFSLDKKGLLWKYMPDGSFKNLNEHQSNVNPNFVSSLVHHFVHHKFLRRTKKRPPKKMAF